MLDLIPAELAARQARAGLGNQQAACQRRNAMISGRGERQCWIPLQCCLLATASRKKGVMGVTHVTRAVTQVATQQPGGRGRRPRVGSHRLVHPRICDNKAGFNSETRSGMKKTYLALIVTAGVGLLMASASFAAAPHHHHRHHKHHHAVRH